MGFWFWMTVTSMLVPGIMMSVGAWMRKHPPKQINWVMGYRSTRSMKSQESWDFANRYSGKLMFRAGWMTLVVSLVVMLLILFRSETVVSIVSVVLVFCQLIPLLAVLPMVEQQLKKRFDEDGNPKEA